MNLGKSTNAPRADMTISDASLTEFIFKRFLYSYLNDNKENQA